jgi:small subunit ribosomal protein S16
MAAGCDYDLVPGFWHNVIATARLREALSPSPGPPSERLGRAPTRPRAAARTDVIWEKTAPVAVKIKLKRMGKIHAPYYRIVVADARTKRDGRAIEEIGKYHPKSEPSLIEVSSERAQYWLSVGAQPTDPVRRLLEITGDWQKFRGEPGAEGTLRIPAPKKARSERFAEAVGQTKAGTETTPKGRTKKADTEAKPDGKAGKADGTAKRKPRTAKAGVADKAADQADGKAADKAADKPDKAAATGKAADKPDKAGKADKAADRPDKAAGKAGKAADKATDKAAGQADKPAKQDKPDEPAPAEAPQAEASPAEEAPRAEAAEEAPQAEAAEEAPQAEAAEEAPQAEAASSGSGD